MLDADSGAILGCSFLKRFQLRLSLDVQCSSQMTPSWVYTYNSQAFSGIRTAWQLAVIGFITAVHSLVLQLRAVLHNGKGAASVDERDDCYLVASQARVVRPQTYGTYHLILICPGGPTDLSTASVIHGLAAVQVSNAFAISQCGASR